jgi:hypothetical protein
MMRQTTVSNCNDGTTDDQHKKTEMIPMFINGIDCQYGNSFGSGPYTT